MIIEKIQKNKKNRGFVILFAVTIAAILLSIALGVANIALKEVKFGTSGRDTNEALFAADTGMERVLFLDKPPTSPYVIEDPELTDSWTVIVSGLGSAGAGCAIVLIGKDNTTPPLKTTIISKGYNNGSGVSTCTPGPNSIERQLESRY